LRRRRKEGEVLEIVSPISKLALKVGRGRSRDHGRLGAPGTCRHIGSREMPRLRAWRAYCNVAVHEARIRFAIASAGVRNVGRARIPYVCGELAADLERLDRRFGSADARPLDIRLISTNNDTHETVTFPARARRML
jgi:hypothetical protein